MKAGPKQNCPELGPGQKLKIKLSRLWPALGVVFPSSGAGGRLGLDSRLRNADGLLRSGSNSRSKRWLGAVFSTDIFVVGQKRSGYPQSLDFFFQPGHFQFLLPENLVNILHIWAPVRETTAKTLMELYAAKGDLSRSKRVNGTDVLCRRDALCSASHTRPGELSWSKSHSANGVLWFTMRSFLALFILL